MLLSDTLQRSYLARRRADLREQWAAAHERAALAASQAHRLEATRACPREITRLDQLSTTLRDRCAQLSRSIVAIEGELLDALDP